MNSRSIEKLRKKFILVATLSFAGVMLLISGLIYATNLFVTRSEVRRILDYIISYEGELPSHSSVGEEYKDTGFPSEYESEMQAVLESADDDQFMELSLFELFGRRSRWFNSPDFSYSTRFFAVLFDADGEVYDVKTNHIAAVSEEEAEEYGRIALRQFFRFGSFGVFYYKVAALENGGKIVVFLDSTDQVATNGRLLITALTLIGLGMCIAFLLMRLLSYRVVRTEIENANRQKQFITNASHELKTPLAVIRANTEVEQMLNGENEWNISTMKQVDRLTGLIGNLVMIARAEEKEDKVMRDVIDISVPVRETAESFQPVAISEEKQLRLRIDDAVKLCANEGEIRQLVSLLTDNAIKYCDKAGEIEIALSQARGKAARLVISNTYAEGAGVDYSRFFDRFYRKDEAHGIDQGGYGIGLSIAESLFESYHGAIDVTWKEGTIHFTCLLKNR